MTRKKRAKIVAGTAALAAGIVLVDYACHIQLPRAEFSAAEVRLLRYSEEGDDIHAATTDTQVIADLVSVIKRATVWEFHACAPVGELTLITSSGDRIRFGILPGHSERRYELRSEGGTYRVNRSAFLNAIERLGVPKEAYLPESGG